MLIAPGAKRVEWRKPALSLVNDLFFACLSADRGSAFKRMLRGNRVDGRIRSLLLTAQTPPWLRGILRAALAAMGQHHAATLVRRLSSGSADAYWQTVEAMVRFRRDFLQSLDTADGGPIDFILCPAYAVPAQRHGASLMMPLPGAYAPLAPVTGLPAGIVPATRVLPGEESDRPESRDQVERVARESERASAGLPIAVQVIARPWRDHVALAAMGAIEAVARTRRDYPARPPL
jgi:fatty acid amide hydrolase